MNDLDRIKIHQAANAEVVRRTLVSYFSNKGFAESFDKSVNPILIQDLPYVNIGLENKVEIEPHAVEIDPSTSRAVLGWNLFVLGNQRIYLGETYHANLLDLARQIKFGSIMPESTITTRRCTTPRRIINFIERVLSKSESGIVDLSPRDRGIATSPRSYKPLGHPGSQEGQFMTRSGYGA